MFESDELDKLIYAMLEGMCTVTAKEDETEGSTLDMDMCKDHEFGSIGGQPVKVNLHLRLRASLFVPLCICYKYMQINHVEKKITICSLFLSRPVLVSQCLASSSSAVFTPQLVLVTSPMSLNGMS